MVDASFTLLDYNEPFVNLVRVGKRRLSHANLMELLLLEEVTRDRWADWENWLEALAAELIEATALHWEESPELQRLHTSVLADPVVGPVYKRSAGYMFPDRNRKLPIRNLLPGVQEITFLHTEDDLSR
ncbi:hypothetical protein AOB60_00625 [Streptomyces noursei]|uniref:MmyB-like transcription regulator ligand binding domain-containing protein n=1 Tax=Streptomyces noursei TaxID=1971 RepID=A0A2N8PR17_STRNR|nr:hypothetical protein AOB60_00625 [Streptomyces noursei]